MESRVFPLESVDPLALYGVNNNRYNLLVRHFPDVRIVARGEYLRAEGQPRSLERFASTVERLLGVLQQRGGISEEEYRRCLVEPEHRPFGGLGGACEEVGASGVEAIGVEDHGLLLVGPKGKVIRARSSNQQLLVERCRECDLLFALGPAGSGKTYTAIALAVRALRLRQVQRIILTRPAVEAGERLGFLPGDLRDKLDPYLQPLYDALNDMLPPRYLHFRLEEGVVQIAPLAYMRGRTLDNAFVILDEAQNATLPQLKMFLTRMGRNAKFIITGDCTQVDLPHPSHSGLEQSVRLLEGVQGVGVVRMEQDDIVRHPLVRAVVQAFAGYEAQAGTPVSGGVERENAMRRPSSAGDASGKS